MCIHMCHKRRRHAKPMDWREDTDRDGRICECPSLILVLEVALILNNDVPSTASTNNGVYSVPNTASTMALALEMVLVLFRVHAR